MGIPYVCTDYNSRPTLVGVASNKIGCRGSDHLAVFTGVVKYKSWIESTMKAMNAHK
uniref:Peptidase S1 domain-containing protein n=1 Tax=Romanomermis culicivorax TaxID=13658 RepID=A0A915IZW4_ROMCU